MTDLYIIHVINASTVSQGQRFNESELPPEYIISIYLKLGDKLNKYLFNRFKSFQLDITKISNLNQREIEIANRVYEKTYVDNCYECQVDGSYDLVYFTSDYIFPALDTFEEGKKILEWMALLE